MAQYHKTEQAVGSYLDGVPFVVSSSMKPPEPVMLPVTYRACDSIDVLSEKYNFDLEDSVVRWVDAQRSAREALEEAQQEKERLMQEALRKQEQERILAEEENRKRMAEEAAEREEEEQIDEEIQTNDDVESGVAKEEETLGSETHNIDDMTSGAYGPTLRSDLWPTLSDNILTPTQSHPEVVREQKKSDDNEKKERVAINIEDFEGKGMDPFDMLELKTLDDMEELKSVLQNSQRTAQHHPDQQQAQSHQPPPPTFGEQQQQQQAQSHQPPPPTLGQQQQAQSHQPPPPTLGQQQQAQSHQPPPPTVGQQQQAQSHQPSLPTLGQQQQAQSQQPPPQPHFQHNRPLPLPRQIQRQPLPMQPHPQPPLQQQHQHPPLLPQHSMPQTSRQSCPPQSRMPPPVPQRPHQQQHTLQDSDQHIQRPVPMENQESGTQTNAIALSNIKDSRKHVQHSVQQHRPYLQGMVALQRGMQSRTTPQLPAQLPQQQLTLANGLVQNPVNVVSCSTQLSTVASQQPKAHLASTNCQPVPAIPPHRFGTRPVVLPTPNIAAQPSFQGYQAVHFNKASTNVDIFSHPPVTRNSNNPTNFASNQKDGAFPQYVRSGPAKRSLDSQTDVHTRPSSWHLLQKQSDDVKMPDDFCKTDADVGRPPALLRSCKSVPDFSELDDDDEVVESAAMRRGSSTPPPRPVTSTSLWSLGVAAPAVVAVPVSTSLFVPPGIPSWTSARPKPVKQPPTAAAATAVTLPDVHALETGHTKLLHSLSQQDGWFVEHIAAMGFSRDLVVRAVQKFGRDDKQVLDYLCQLGPFQEKGFSAEDAEKALKVYSDNAQKAVEFLELVAQFRGLGFQEEAIESALLKHENDRDRALDELLA